MRCPLEVRLAAGLLVGCAALFLLTGLLRLADEGGDGLVPLPLLQLALATGVAGGLLRGFAGARLAGIALAMLGGLLHMLLALGAAPWWARVVSGLLAAVQIYIAVLLNTRPAVQFIRGARR